MIAYVVRLSKFFVKSLIVVFVLPILAYAMGVDGDIDRYAHCRITEQSVGSLAAPSTNINAVARHWLAEQSDLIEPLLRDSDASNYFEYFHHNCDRLQAAGLRLLSENNYLFAVPALPNYMMRITGTYTRVAGSLAHEGHSYRNIRSILGPYHMKQRPQEFPIDFSKVVCRKTYSAASRAATYLRLKELQDEGLLAVKVPVTFIMPFDASRPLDDTNAIVVQERVPDEARPFFGTYRLSLLSDTVLTQLMAMIVYAGLWDIYENLLYDASHDQFYLVDLEQAPHERPAEFYHQNRARYEESIVMGFAGLMHGVKGQLRKLQRVQSYIQNNVRFAFPEMKQRIFSIAGIPMVRSDECDATRLERQGNEVQPA